MIKKVVIGVVVALLVLVAGSFFWVRAVLGTEPVRSALASQLSRALGQPVAIQSLTATIYPRVTVHLTGVTIGEGEGLTVKSLDLGTAFGALLSRRIEHATLRVSDARVQLPLPTFALGPGGAAPAATEAPAGSPVELVSIDEIVLTGIELVSRGRTLRGNIELVPHGTTAVTIRRVALTADGARVDATGEISNLAGPVGTLDIKAGALDLDHVLAFVSDFTDGSATPAQDQPAGATPGSTAPAQGASTRDLTVNLAADRATMSGVSLERVNGRAMLKGDRLSVDPITFGLFGGNYEGALGATLGSEPSFTWKAALKGVDLASVTALAGNAGAITGRLAGRIDVTGLGSDAASAMKTARGTAQVTITDGVVRNLALVKSAVAATSLNPQAVIASSQGPQDEPFSEMGATLAIAGGTASTRDLHFVSKDIRLDAAGALKLDGSAVSLKGAVQLSEELTKQANATLVRAAAQDGRITLPAAVIGTAGRYSIEIDASAMAKRAVTNEAKSQAQQAMKKGLGRLLGR